MGWSGRGATAPSGCSSDRGPARVLHGERRCYSPLMLDVCLIGAGRIGRVHAQNLTAHPRARVRWVIDRLESSARSLAEAVGAHWSLNPGDGLADPQVRAVWIASPTSTHVDMIRAAARAGKPIFCEKPIALALDRYDEAMAEVEAADVPLFVGFNRRFDPSFRRVKAELATGSVGKLELVQIISRDPSPPPVEYLEHSGGLFRDMMIHDLDMASWLLGDEPIEVYAVGSALVDAQIGRLGDVDTALVTLRTAEGVLCQISNSRRATYGYDQRLEVLGSKGMLRAENVQPDTVSRWTEDGGQLPRLLDFFVERYAAAYRAELDHFVRALEDPSQPLLTGPADGRRALRLADAAAESLESGQPVRPG
jgi:myo-inositol 2-dehydrogenase / D-chiro-inositol 1-dehydrogenase